MRSYFRKKITLVRFDTALGKPLHVTFSQNFGWGWKKIRQTRPTRTQIHKIQCRPHTCQQYSNAQTPQHKQTPSSFDLIIVIYLCNLDTPVEQQLRSNVVLVLVHIVEEAAVGHELGDQLDGGAQADTEETHQVGVLHAGHDQGLLGERGGRRTKMD